MHLSQFLYSSHDWNSWHGLFSHSFAESPIPINVILAVNHSIFVKGDNTNFEIEESFGVEASELYPEVKYTTVEEYLENFV